jgi:DNA-binding MarR family transcriptional regulator
VVLSDETIAALRAHPRFREAAALAAAASVDFYQGNWLANRVLNDRARFLITQLCMYLHYTRRPDEPASGLTAARMRDICIANRICSAGRAEAMLLMMRAGGYLLRETVQEDRRVRRYVPTEKLVSLVRERQKRVLRAADLLQARPRFVTALESDPQFYPRFVSNMSESFLAGFRMTDFVPELERIFERDAGLIILLSVFLAGPAYRVFAPEQNVSVFGLSRRFHVSRAHVRAVLADAEKAALVRRGDDAVQPLPKLTEAMEKMLGTGFAYATACAERALDHSLRVTAAV